MNVLIDTNILLWILFDSNSLTFGEKSIIENGANQIIISGISLFEISLKYSIMLYLTDEIPRKWLGMKIVPIARNDDF